MYIHKLIENDRGLDSRGSKKRGSLASSIFDIFQKVKKTLNLEVPSADSGGCDGTREKPTGFQIQRHKRKKGKRTTVEVLEHFCFHESYNEWSGHDAPNPELSAADWSHCGRRLLSILSERVSTIFYLF